VVRLQGCWLIVVKQAVDVVAVILALALCAAVTLILITAIINVIDHQAPTPTLGENTTQVLTSAVGGVVGILGGYVGHSLTTRRHDDDHD
jgi:hypothetical protein